MKKPPWRVRASFDVTRPTRLTARPRGPNAVKAPVTRQNSGPTLHPWRTKPARSGGQVSQVGASPILAILLSTHLMSKASRDALACSFMTPVKIACALFHGLFIGSSSRVARVFTPLNESGLLVRPCWISFNTFLRATHGSDPLSEPQEYHHFCQSNIPWSRSVSSRSNRFRSSCLRRASVKHTSCVASSSVMPVPRTFLQLPHPTLEASNACGTILDVG